MHTISLVGNSDNIEVVMKLVPATPLNHGRSFMNAYF
jgi:hypothetical protein